METSRRFFLHQFSMAFGSILLMPACTGYHSPWRFFEESEAQTVIAFAEQIIPADKDPGATEAGVIHFIDKQLAGRYSRFQDMYRTGIAGINSSSVHILHKAFYELEWEEQTYFMEQMESGNLPEEHWQDVNQRSFFSTLLDHSMQGFYGSPRHGGNKNYLSYKMMHIDYPHVLGQNRYNTTCNTAKGMEV